MPRVVGYTLAAARERLASQPLTPNLVWKPAQPNQRVNVVLRQYPASGRLSSYDTVTLVLAKPVHGVVPRVVGLSLRDARAKLKRVKLAPVVTGLSDGRPGRITAQAPLGGVAAAPGMRIRLTLARG